MRRMYTIIAVSIVLLFCGCKSQVPKPTSYNFSTQQKMQAAHHWDILAKDVALQIKKKLNDKNGGSIKEVYVKNNEDTDFTKSFHELLVDHLVEQGVYITKIEKKASIVAQYDVNLIHHRHNIEQRPWPGTRTAQLGGTGLVLRNIDNFADLSFLVPGSILTGAAVDASHGYNVKLPRHEAIITTTLMEDDRVLLKKTDIYYVNDKDHWHYENYQSKIYKVSD